MRKTFLLFWAAVVLLILFFWIYLPTLSKYRDLKARYDEIEREIDVLDGKIQKLAEEKTLLMGDVQYLEKVIREEMGLVKPGEVVYKFVPEKQNRMGSLPDRQAGDEEGEGTSHL